MKNILVPTDFGDQTEIALDYAIQIARKQKANITLLHVMNFPSLGESKEENGKKENWENIVRLAESDVKAKLKELSKKYDAVDIKGKVLVGSALMEILCFQREGKFNLVILGIEETQGLGDHLFGSFTDRIVHQSSVPVLVVKRKSIHKNLSKIIVGNSYKVNETELSEYIATVKLLFENAEIDIVRVNSSSDFMSEDIFDERVKKMMAMDMLKGCSFHSINYSNQGNGLIYYASKTKSDLIVICDKHRSSIRGWMVDEDLAEKVMDFSNIPVLIL